VKNEVKQGAAVGDGPVDAVCRAISTVTGSSAKLARYEIRAVTSGTEAMGEVTVQLEDGGLKVMGRAASTDVIEASARAFIDGLNKLASLMKRSAERGSYGTNRIHYARAGMPAAAFQLPDVVSGRTISLDSFADAKAMLVMFICRHCPFVQHVREELARLGKDYAGKPWRS